MSVYYPVFQFHNMGEGVELHALGARGPETSDYMLRTLRALVK